jgi:hypothetical protein
MNREEWNKLSEDSKWRIYISKYLDFLDNVEFKANTIINDTRKDNSEECDYLCGVWHYINPFNNKQVMMYGYDGFQVHSVNWDLETIKSKGKKSVWQKVESIEELKVGDFIRMYDYADDKYRENLRGILTKIDSTVIVFQYFHEDGVRLYLFYFNDFKNVEKAVLVEG